MKRLSDNRVMLIEVLDRPDGTAARWNMSWEAREKLADRFEEINFGCNFCEGKCAGSGTRSSEAACCSGCAFQSGYLVGANPKHRQTYLDNFDDELGFWRKGRGCILPRALRSSICLSYQCPDAKRNAPHANLHTFLAELQQYLHFSLRT